MPTVNEDDVCRVCKYSFQWHQENNPRHPFTPEGGSLDFLKRRGTPDHTAGRSTSPRGSDTSPIPMTLSDPVLRIALMNRGVISAADLVIAESQLREALAAVRSEDGQGEVQEREATSLHVGSRAQSGQEVGPQPQNSSE